MDWQVGGGIRSLVFGGKGEDVVGYSLGEGILDSRRLECMAS